MHTMDFMDGMDARHGCERLGPSYDRSMERASMPDSAEAEATFLQAHGNGGYGNSYQNQLISGIIILTSIPLLW